MVDLALSYAYKVRDYIANVKSQGEQTINLIRLKLNDELKNSEFTTIYLKNSGLDDLTLMSFINLRSIITRKVSA